MEVIAALLHPAILTIDDVGTHLDRIYAVMELLEGETLAKSLERGKLDWRQAVRIGVATGEGLSAAHGKGIVHRDIKPSNLFLTGDGAVKILYFGLARLAEGASSATSPEAPVAMVGTASFRAPEQIRGQEADARSDLFSLARVIYELVAGPGSSSRPAAADGPAEDLREEPDLSGLPAEIPPELRRILAHGLEPDPDRRFQSARDLAFALEGIRLT